MSIRAAVTFLDMPRRNEVGGSTSPHGSVWPKADAGLLRHLQVCLQAGEAETGGLERFSATFHLASLIWAPGYMLLARLFLYLVYSIFLGVSSFRNIFPRYLCRGESLPST